MSARKSPTHDEFVKVWRRAAQPGGGGLSWAAQRLGMLPRSASIRACRARKSGIDLPAMPSPRGERLTKQRVAELNRAG